MHEKTDVLRDQHARLSSAIVDMLGKMDFLETEKWADLQGLSDVWAAQIITEAADMLHHCYFEEPIIRKLQTGDIYGKSGMVYLLLSLSGNSAYVLDLNDFSTISTTIDPDREYVVYGIGPDWRQ